MWRCSQSDISKHNRQREHAQSQQYALLRTRLPWAIFGPHIAASTYNEVQDFASPLPIAKVPVMAQEIAFVVGRSTGQGNGPHVAKAAVRLAVFLT